MTEKALRVVLPVAVVVLLAIGGVACLGTGMCAAHVVRRVASPDGRLEAVIFERNCGATTDFGTSLSVVRTGSQVGSEAGNLLVADSDHGRAPLDSGNVIRLSIEWVGSDSLIVRFDRRARVFQQRATAFGVNVRYIPG